MDIYRFVLAHVPQSVASLGLFMDIVGIGLLYRFGAIGGAWIDARKRELQRSPERLSSRRELQQESDPWHPMREAEEFLVDEEVERNEHRALVGSRWGLGLAVAGFGLQALAQWL